MSTPLMPAAANRRSLGRRIKRLTATCVTAVMVVTLAQQVPALAEEAADNSDGPARVADPIPPVAVREVNPAAVTDAPALATAADKPAPVWPVGGVGVAVVPAAPVRPAPGELVPDGGIVSPAQAAVVGGLPVRAGHVEGTASPGRVYVQVFAQAATVQAGVMGVLLRATPQDAAGQLATGETSARLSVDYSAFATGFGADWASRLRLVVLRDCALANQGGRGCVGQALLSDNNLTARTVSASIPFNGESVLVALQAAVSGPAGTYSATSLQPSSTWSAGGNSGGFTWSYPMRVPPGAGGPTPTMGLWYSSQSVDGRHAASNNQPSWAGEGFEAWPGGFIERRYKACADDMGSGANNGRETGDLCWVRNNAVLNLNGSSGELIYNASEDRWHLRSEDGSRIERRTGATNGDDNGEYWVVTTTDGTQYWFGIDRLPGWASGDEVTESTWTVPVFGNHPGEPCHAAAFGDSDCNQAWRWNLDYVVDVHGNSMSYWYDAETNKYARNLSTADDASYIRGGYLRRISYGTRRVNSVDNALDADAPALVHFTAANRCLANCTIHDEAHWPDTPWDQECTGTSCTSFSPTFWTTKRLGIVRTRVWDGAAYREVERWQLVHSFPDPGDTTRAGLWLSQIMHEGQATGATPTTVPDVSFTPVSLDNRVDAIDHSPAMAWHRIARIETETGGAIAITYSDPDCEDSKPTLHTNTRRCYPVFWTPEGEQDPQLDWFHKYVVDELREADMVGGQPGVLHDYEYFGAAWHYTDDDGLIEDEAKTWSAWRGYRRVTETVGEGTTNQTFTETRYFQGMNDDKLPTGIRSVNVTDSNGGTWPDDDWFAGMAREQITFDGPDGGEVAGQINDPWASSATATRTIDGSTVHARFTNTATVRSRTALEGNQPDRVTRVTTSFDSRGMPTQIEDYGDVDASGDEQCLTHTYTPRNGTIWLMDKIHRIRSFAVACAAVADPASLGDNDVITHVRNWYDNNAHGTVATRGLVTRTEEMSAWNAGSPTYVTTGTSTYDAHGRVLEVRDALGNPTRTAYTPVSGGPVTSTTTTNALGHVTTTTVDPAWGLATRTVDPNGKTTNMTYDGLGRLTAVWLPGRDPATQTANLTFAYGVRNNNVTFVTSRRLGPMETYLTSHSLFDGLLRQIQTQVPSPSISGGRILTNTFYDNAGRAFQTYGSYYTTDNPSTSLHVPIEPLNVPTQTLFEFDGAGRTTAEIFRPFHAERWRTTTDYGGDHIDVTPPAGGTATTTISDARGRTVELRQYHGATPTGTHDSTIYDYDRKGQLAGVTDPAGNQWTYAYDLRGRKIEVHDPDAGIARIEYDDADRITATIEGNNEVLVHQYDALGRKIRVYWSMPIGQPLASWSYDTVAKGQLERMTRFTGNQSYVTAIRSYDDWYQPTQVDVIIPAAETGLAGTYSTHYSYNADGSPRSVAWTDTADLFNEGVHYDYDITTGLPIAMEASSGATTWSYVADTAYNALAQVEQLTLRTTIESGTEADAVRLGYQRELETGRMTNTWVSLEKAPFMVADTRYGYDPSGNITKIQDMSANPDDTQCFGYDYLRRLTEAWTPSSNDCAATPAANALGGPAPYWLSWTYDAAGNRRSQTDHRTTGDLTTTYTYPAAGSPQPHTLTAATTASTTGSWTYDDAGNTLARPDPDGGQQTLTWDRQSYLSTVTDEEGTTRYIYDADGNRLITRDPGGKTLYLPGQEVRWDAATGLSRCTRYYDYHGQIIASRTVDGLTWLASDHQGTTQVAITEQGQQVQQRRQTPFGTSRGSNPVWPNRRGFVGGEVEATGMVHLGAREYDPVVGRFISVDPIMNLTDPQQMHGYAYANNNPITWSDPSGLLCTPDGHNLCPDQPVEQQPNYDLPSNGGGGTYDGACANPAQCDSWQNEPYIIASGTEEHGTTRTVWSDGTVDINGWMLPPNNPAAAELAQLVDEMMFGGDMPLEETYKAISIVCEEGHMDCDLDFMAAVFGRTMAMSMGVGSWTEAFTLGLTESALGALRMRLRSGRVPLSPQQAFCRNNSFEPGTLVLMADGTSSRIEDVEAGDWVKATDPESGLTEPKVVVETITGAGSRSLVDITAVADDAGPTLASVSTQLDFGSREGIAVTATANHRFWLVSEARWVEAEDLQRGDQLLAYGGIAASVSLVREYRDTLVVHNLTIADFHTYFVHSGSVAVLVHNDGCRPANLSPPGAARPGAFNEAKRDAGIPTSMSPTRILPNLDRRGNRQPGRVYEFDIPAPGGGTRTVRIRDDARGHFYPDNPSQNRGPHFNTEVGGHYDY